MLRPTGGSRDDWCDTNQCRGRAPSVRRTTNCIESAKSLRAKICYQLLTVFVSLVLILSWEHGHSRSHCSAKVPRLQHALRLIPCKARLPVSELLSAQTQPCTGLMTSSCKSDPLGYWVARSHVMQSIIFRGYQPDVHAAIARFPSVSENTNLDPGGNLNGEIALKQRGNKRHNRPGHPNSPTRQKTRSTRSERVRTLIEKRRKARPRGGVLVDINRRRRKRQEK
jgi:hypothetical protein